METRALSQALHSGQVSDAIIDVWENEPDINRTLLEQAFIATPHIAGYSADGKANATRMALDAFCRHFGLTPAYQITPPPPATADITAATLEEALLQTYNPRRDSDELKTHPEWFEKLRGDYPLRRERGAYRFHLSR